MYVEIFVSKKQRACLQGWALASTFHFPFCHSWFLHCIISCITSAQSGLISWKCKIKIKPRVSRWHSLLLSSPNPCALLGKWELISPTVKWPPALEGSGYPQGRDKTETLAKQQDTHQKAVWHQFKGNWVVTHLSDTLYTSKPIHFLLCLLSADGFMGISKLLSNPDVLFVFLHCCCLFCNLWITT